LTSLYLPFILHAARRMVLILAPSFALSWEP